MGVVAAAELRDQSALAARFGGGSFLLLARDPTNMRIATRVRVSVAGPARPCEDEGRIESPASRRKTSSPSERPHATRAGMLADEVFQCLDEGKPLGEVMRATGAEPRVLRGLYLEWLTPFGAELPKTPEEIQKRIEAKRAERLADWGDDLVERARQKEEPKAPTSRKASR